MERLTGSLVALATAATISAPLALNAPADVYFGPFKYSAISTRTKIDALGRAYRERWENDASLVHDAGMVESSLRDWAQRYPRDSWLAPTAFHLAQLYMEIQTPDARVHAKQMFQYVAQTFPKTAQGHLARVRLQQGFPPLHDETPVAPTPSPYGPSAGASAAPGAAAPAASAAPVEPGAPGGAPSPVASAAPAMPAAIPSGAPPSAGPSSPAPASAPAPKASSKPSR